MATLIAEYKGDLHVTCEHLASGAVIETDAPIDNQGKGEAFSPTDLCVASLASCILTIMGIKAKTSGFDITGATIEGTKTMNESPRRIGSIDFVITMPNKQYSEKERTILERVVDSCPVHLSLHPDISTNVVFIWAEKE
ncbi:MAG: OsmC family protein [Marinifilaceae bacterium]